MYKHILLWIYKIKYRKNWYRNKPIHVSYNHRGLGLTTIIVKDAIKYKYPILVRSERAKSIFAHEIYQKGQLGIVPAVTEKYAYEYMIVTPNDADKLKVKYLPYIFVDNSCTESDVISFLSKMPYTEIVNGFISNRI